MNTESEVVTADYLRRSAERLMTLKTASYEHMAIASGATVLDVGCGPGVDAVALAQRVGARGRVIAVDADPNMITEAHRQAETQGMSERITLQTGSALALPLADGTVAASRAERLIQVLPPGDAPAVVAELRRVTSPGGRVVLVDTDWGSGTVDLSNIALERRLMAFFAQRMRPNGFAGRQLFGLAREARLEHLRVDTYPVLEHGLDTTPIEWLLDTARKEGEITPEEHGATMGELRQREAEGRLYFFAAMVIVSGEVPQG